MDSAKSNPVEIPAAAATAVNKATTTTTTSDTKHSFLSLSPSKSSPPVAAAAAAPSSSQHSSASSDASSPSLDSRRSISISETIEPLGNTRNRAGSSGSVGGGGTFLWLGPMEED